MLVASTLTDLAVFIPSVCGGMAVLLTAVGSLVLVFRGNRALTAKVEEVHAEVKTGNGQTLGKLADIAEGRAAQAIPEEERTPAEQEHADMKVETELAAGHAPPPVTS